MASLTLGQIAEEEGLTHQYAGKIFRILARARLVASERGRNGGYRLTRRPEEIKVSEVLTALAGKFFDRKLCGRYRGSRTTCVHTSNCTIRLLWLEVERVVDQVLTRASLKDLVLRERAMEEALKTLPMERALAGVGTLTGGGTFPPELRGGIGGRKLEPTQALTKGSDT